MRFLKKIVSGGQTGVDRAALDVAEKLGLKRGGWCPRFRRAEDGPVPEDYPLIETPSEHYGQRTEWNVRDSDATLILYMRELRGGSHLTYELAQLWEKPVLIIDLLRPGEEGLLAQWLESKRVSVLNVAGPRESDALAVYDEARIFLERELQGFFAE
jgi:hypothetical protein